MYVKVSMDGAPYLRKVDIKMYSSYEDLSMALEKMFSCFITGELSGVRFYASVSCVPLPLVISQSTAPFTASFGSLLIGSVAISPLLMYS